MVKKSTTITDRLIEELSVKRKLSNYAIASAIGTYVGTVDSWLVGKKDGPNKPRKFSIPSVSFLVQLCDKYGMDLMYLATGEYSQAPKKEAEKEYKQPLPKENTSQDSPGKTVPEIAIDELFTQYNQRFDNLQQDIDELEEKYAKLKTKVNQIERITMKSN